jgi:SAM-dependent methyltransferase
MLYHLPDRAKGLAEARRVLAPGGRFYATTIGPGHMSEVLANGLARRYGVHGRQNPSFDPNTIRGFSLANGGDQLAPYFSNIRLRLYEDSLVVTDPEPLIAYILSTMTMDEEEVDRLRGKIEEEIAGQGAVHVTKSSGMFMAMKEV